jgi:CRISPR-associated protein Csb2
MAQHFVLTLRRHDARYHGMSEWPPSPARAFQALVAGSARGNALSDESRRALEWLEQQPAPTIAAPQVRAGQRIDTYVPNNDADTLAGDLTRVGEIRVKKAIRPQLLEGDSAFIYAWPIAQSSTKLERLLMTAEHVYQFGRGVDMAWACAELLDDTTLDERLAAHRGTLHVPTLLHGQCTLACPTSGSLDSLGRRHAAQAKRLRSEGEGRELRYLFTQPSKPHFIAVTYDAAKSCRVFELRRASDADQLYPWPMTKAVALVERIRDALAERLRRGLPESAQTIERLIVGRSAEAVGAAPIEQRIRILPLPSIGHEHADRAIRRVAVEVPAGGALTAADVYWACSGLETHDATSGELDPFVLTVGEDSQMLRHYVTPARRWRTVTPAVLPETARRRRIEPTRQREEAKTAAERDAEEQRAVAAVRSALRHTGVRARPVTIRVQREPFEAKGARVEPFSINTRFAKERLWHVEVEFADTIEGPLALGDGRFLGLGLAAPWVHAEGVHAFVIASGLKPAVDPIGIARAFRRAVMSRVHAELGGGSGRRLPTFFAGHSAEGGAARTELSSHLAFHYDPIGRLIVFAPHVVDQRAATRSERDHLTHLDRALSGLQEVRAGRDGLLLVRRTPLNMDRDALCARSRSWVSVTPYAVNRHRKGVKHASDALTADLVEDCARHGLPRPRVVNETTRGVAGRGLEGLVRLEFQTAVPGPLLLGRTRFLGGGLFTAAAK